MAKFIGGKLYYNAYPKGTSMRKTTLYKCNKNGSSRKVIKTFKTSQQYGMVIAYPQTSKYCTVYKDSVMYKYTFKTKKLTKIIR